jgi:quinol monooxygenase YgiN
MLKKRRVLMMTMAAAPLAAAGAQVATPAAQGPLYGLIGKIKAKPGQREELAKILLAGTRSMPGCFSYIVANDPTDADALWITEVWDSADSHKASLALPAVKEAITAGRPLIAGFGERFETQPLGGTGLPGQ